MSDDWHFRPYVSVAERLKRAEKAASKLIKKGEKLAPVRINGRTIARTFWGKAWCDHLESYSDYENRLPRGRTYARNGSVIHLSVEKGELRALVQGSSLYKVKIKIEPVGTAKWQKIVDGCSSRIDSVVELLQGKLSSSVMLTITDRNAGLFPQPKEITLSCSCPDWAEMCKHVAAVLYGVGARLDEDPELLFKLRHVDHLDLIEKASFKVPGTSAKEPKIITDQNLSDLFGIDIETTVDVPTASKAPAKRQAKSTKRQDKSAKRAPRKKKTSAKTGKGRRS